MAMVKNGRVEPGKTPCEQCGRASCTCRTDGKACCGRCKGEGKQASADVSLRDLPEALVSEHLK